MESKKRKREAELPRVTYDAATRTFDRLFKEDSLEDMKNVVRKKLSLSSSFPVYLSQMREGKSVDLEDDDDFEAFAASAHASSTVKVKVILGDAPFAVDSEFTTPSGKRKRKKKSKRDLNALSTSGDNLVELPDTANQSKRQKVSFEEEPLNAVSTSSKADKRHKSSSDDSLEVGANPSTNTEPESEQPDEVDLVKIKKKSKKSKKITEDGESAQNQLIENSSISPRSTVGPLNGIIMGEDKSSSTLKPKKSKKRQRPDSPVTGIIEHAILPTEAPTQNANVGESERVQKKSKKNVTIGVDPEVHLPPVVQPPTLLADSPLHIATAEEPTLKARKRKQKGQPPAEGHATSDIVSANPNQPEKAAPDAPTNPSTKKLAAKGVTIAELPTHVESTVPVSKKSSATEVPAKEVTVEKSKKSKQKRTEEGSKISEANPKKSKEVSLPQATSTSAAAMSSKGKSKKGKDGATEIGNPDDVVAEDIQNTAVATSAKTPKKGNKQKIGHTKIVEQSSTTQAIPQVQNANATEAIDLKEVTRKIVENIMKKAANKISPSSPAVVQPVTQPVVPVASGQDEIVQAIAATSTSTKSIVVPSQSVTVGATVLKETAVADSGPSVKEPNVPTACPICNSSPVHVRSKCPIIKSGIKAMRKKVAELQQETSEEDAESRSSVILELQGIIERRTKKPRVSEIAKPADAPLPMSSTDPAEKEAEPLVPAVNSPKSQPIAESNAGRTPLSQLESQVLASVHVSSPNKSKTIVPDNEPTSPSSAQKGAPRLSLSQPSSQLLSSIHSSSSKAANGSQGAKQPIQAPTTTADNLLSSQLNGFGDVSLFTDKDLDILIRGPRLSIKNAVPDSDSSTEEESDREEVVLEDDQVENKKLARNISRSGYPSSSDEGEEEEGSGPSTPHKHQVPSDNEEGRDVGNLSFGDLNATGSSVEPDRMGDLAAVAAVAADLAPLNLADLAEPAQEIAHEDDANQKRDSPESDVPTPADSPHPPKATAENDNADPIEPSDAPLASQPELIVSDDEGPPVGSPPKSEVVVRTRSQRNATIAKSDPKTSQKSVSQSKSSEVEVEEVPKPTRRTRNLVKITELPVPPNPSIRVIRQAAVPTPRTRRQIALEQEKEKEGTPEPELTLRSRRATTAAKTKTPAKPPSKVTKTTAKPLSKQKIAAKSVVDDKEPTGNSNNVEADLSETNAAPLPEKGGAISSWETLRETVPSQPDTETPGMVDELLSSPRVMPTTSPLSRTGNKQKALSLNGSQPDPLFIPAESQQSFPYSQYPDIPPKNTEPASPNDSDDEEEVAATVGKSITASINSTYRSLRELASQPSRLFQPRPSQISSVMQETRVEDLYGQSGRQSEDSDSSTDSDAGDKPVKAVSHIPASRRAGASQTKKK